MPNPWSAAPYGVDPLARQMAEAAAASANTRLSGCRLGAAVTGPAIVAGRTVDVTVSWPEPITVPYRVEVVAGPGLIGTASLSVRSQSDTGCVVRVTALLAVAAGAVVLAHATF